MTLGTRLLVDDVTLVQAVGVEEVPVGDPSLHLSSNPAQEGITLRTAENERVLAFRLLDVAGHELPVVRQADGTIACDHLADGLYMVAARTASGEHRARRWCGTEDDGYSIVTFRAFFRSASFRLPMVMRSTPLS